MKVTVITVAYNAAATIGDTLRSVAAQGHADLEHLVIDGASTDGTRAVFEANAGPRSQWFSAPDKGLYDAMNRGVAQASGDLIGFLNADDFFCRTDAVALLDAAATASDAAAVSAGVAIVEAGAIDHCTRSYGATSFAPWMLRFGHMPPHPGFYARAKVFRRLGGFDTGLRIGADFEWLLRFYLVHHLRAQAMPETLVTLRDGGLSNSGFGSRRRINAEALASLRRHKVATAAPVVWSKYAVKALQYAARPVGWPAPAAVRFDPRLTLPAGTANPEHGISGAGQVHADGQQRKVAAQ